MKTKKYLKIFIVFSLFGLIFLSQTNINAKTDKKTYNNSENIISRLIELRNSKVNVKDIPVSNESIANRVDIKSATESSVSVSSINLNTNSIILNAWSDYEVRYSIQPENAVNKKLTWTSENTNVATVDENGKITGVSAGITWINATTNDGSNIMVSIQVMVTGGYIYSNTGLNWIFDYTNILLTTNDVTLEVGQKVDVDVISTFGADDSSYKWVSMNTRIATVDATGVITAEKEGTTGILIASYDGQFIRQSLNVTVVPATINYNENDNIPRLSIECKD